MDTKPFMLPVIRHRILVHWTTCRSSQTCKCRGHTYLLHSYYQQETKKRNEVIIFLSLRLSRAKETMAERLVNKWLTKSQECVNEAALCRYGRRKPTPSAPKESNIMDAYAPLNHSRKRCIITASKGLLLGGDILPQLTRPTCLRARRRN